MKNLVISLLLIPQLLKASAFGVPDGDTGLLISIVSNTTEQVTRLEKLISNSEKQLEYTKRLKETSDALESSYDRLTNIQSTLDALSSVGNRDPEDLQAINESKEAQASSQAISEDSKADPEKIKEIVKLDQVQIKRANSSSVRNQSQETAKNTAYISSKLTETNLLLRKNAETNSQTNALFAKNLAKQASDEQKNLEYLGVIKSDKKGN